jgi:hypothetical protein
MSCSDLLERIPIPIEVVILLPSRADAGNWQDSYQQTVARLSDLGRAEQGCARAPAVISLSEEMLASSLLRYSLDDADGSFECLDEWRLKPEYLDRYCAVSEWRPDSRSKMG